MKLEDIDSDNVKVTDLETMFSVYLDNAETIPST